jgi:hypothetical protein
MSVVSALNTLSYHAFAEYTCTHPSLNHMLRLHVQPEGDPLRNGKHRGSLLRRTRLDWRSRGGGLDDRVWQQGGQRGSRGIEATPSSWLTLW